MRRTEWLPRASEILASDRALRVFQMKKFRFYIALVIACPALFGVLFAVSKTGQSQGRKSSGVKQTAIVRERDQTSASFGAAAARNAALRNDLTWIFGGKPQRGWYLYQALIGQTLRTQNSSDTSEFAAALAAWQQKSGLKPTGVLDDQSLYAFVSAWQGRRLKDRTPAEPHQLLIAPASDFYDPQRVDELRQVERNTFAAYKRMVAAAIADRSLRLASDGKQLAPQEKFLKIISSYRTREYQDRLRRESPNAGSAGLAVNSPHFTGRALDLYVGGEPVETNDPNRAIQVNTPVYKWLVRNAERFGFRPYYFEPWHWEYVGS